MDSTCFSTGALAIVGTLLAALAGAVGVLFRALLAAKDDTIDDLQGRLDHVLSISGEAVGVTREIVRHNARTRG